MLEFSIKLYRGLAVDWAYIILQGFPEVHGTEQSMIL